MTGSILDWIGECTRPMFEGRQSHVRSYSLLQMYATFLGLGMFGDVEGDIGDISIAAGFHLRSP
jgi:hypothetical protein